MSPSRSTFGRSSSARFGRFRRRSGRSVKRSSATHSLAGSVKTARASEVAPPGEDLVVPLEVLHEVRATGRGPALSGPTPDPLVPLSSADLLLNARGDPSVGVAVEREIHAADRIDILCAFVGWNGLRIIRPALQAHRDAGRPLRVVTTVYTGSTERRALDSLASIGAEVKLPEPPSTGRRLRQYYGQQLVLRDPRKGRRPLLALDDVSGLRHRA